MEKPKLKTESIDTVKEMAVPEGRTGGDVLPVHKQVRR